MSGPILPGATLGMFGSGQLGRMFALAARRLGYRVHVFSPEADSPMGHIADREFVADYLDLDAVREFARSIAVASFEFENVPAATTEEAANFVPVRPGGHVLAVTQNRLDEKGTLARAGLPVTPFTAVRSIDDLLSGLVALGVPAVLKTCRMGYDGKGQVLIRSLDEAIDAWTALATDEAILEAFIPFEREISVVAARSLEGDFRAYPAFENAHANHILDVTLCPARLTQPVLDEAREIARSIFEALDVVGVLCVEFFVAQGGRLLINELAPRPHNSGHLTIDAHVTCQFEQQVRAICGLPLGSTEQIRPACMVNLLGDLWSGGEPDWSAALTDDGVRLHLYGKSAPRAGRKMGHLTVLADNLADAERRAFEARAVLRRA